MHEFFVWRWFNGYSDYQGGKILTGGSVLESEGNFVQPTIVEISPDAPVVKEELFGPVLYVMKFQVAYFLYLFLLDLVLLEFTFVLNLAIFLLRLWKKQLL